MQNKIIVAILSAFVLIDIGLVYLALAISPIKLKRECFVYEYGETISTKVEDYVNGNESILQSVQLNLDKVSTEVGKYQASVTYFNETYPFEIEVVDTARPKVKLKQIEFHIRIGQKIKAKDLIEKVEDFSKTTVYFYDEDTKELSQSKSYVKEGSYIERIIVEDVYGNQSSALRVKIVVYKNRVKPELHGVDDIAIEVGSIFDPLDGISATDDLEGDITYKIQVSGEVNTMVAGEYRLLYSVSDNEGNIVKKIREVTVEE